MDFFYIGEKVEQDKITKEEVIVLTPRFLVGQNADLMIRGKAFYAIWDEDKGFWSLDEYDVARIIDQELTLRKKELEALGHKVRAAWARDFSNQTWTTFRRYLNNVNDTDEPLDGTLKFANDEIKRSDYATKTLPYSLNQGECPAYEQIASSLYDPEERAKLEWAVGSVIAGDSKHIQKFIVIYGQAGAGKSTYLNIVEQLFEGYTATFEAKALGSNNGTFATAAFKTNPLVAIQHDGDLSRIEDNTTLNSIIAHENILINEKFKTPYTARINSMLFMGTNRPVKITDSKSGIIRRLIDVSPSGRLIEPDLYFDLMAQIPFELGAIAAHCLNVYRSMGKNYYANLKPLAMMYQTDTFYNYVEENFGLFKDQEVTTLKQAYVLYKEYVTDNSLSYTMPRYAFREELKSYFDHFEERQQIDGQRYRSFYTGFKADKFTQYTPEERHVPRALVLDATISQCESILAECPAQYAEDYGHGLQPAHKWDACKTTLQDLDTSKTHYVKPPINHIVIDFDLKGDDGQKSAELNLDAASKWPATYAEFSQGGSGVHLHYVWTGPIPPEELSRVFADGIEVKVFNGNGSLRRRLGLCNDLPVAELSSGLSGKERKVINQDVVITEKTLRKQILQNLRKEIHGATKPSVDFIAHILDEAYVSGVSYDVSDLKEHVIGFASQSSNQAIEAMKMASKAKYKSEEVSVDPGFPQDGRIAYFDLEVFPNLIKVGYMFETDGDDVYILTNPTSAEIEPLLSCKLIGFNNRKYDNHILYGIVMGMSVSELYGLSQRLIDNDREATFSEAYKLSYADIYDYANKKQSLKRWQIELGLHHKELGLPWEEPVPEKMWPLVDDYLKNDVRTTRQVHHARRADFEARQILASLSGLTVNDTTQRHTTKIIFGNDKNPVGQFVYTDLSEMFPGYEFSFGKSTYRGEEVGEGGYVYEEPGMYENVGLIDVVSMHPTSLINLNLFGDRYTQNFKDILDARVAVKHGDLEAAREMLGGKLAPFLGEGADLAGLSYALKIAINIVYGLTSAKFQNPFLDKRNKDNIVAKRGALFMIDLKHALQERGCVVAHIKTDSVKIPNATPEDIQFVMEFGRKYGYEFEHEATYEKLCLVNAAVYCAKADGKWTTVGKQYQEPVVYKTLFSKEGISFDDYIQTKTVTTSLHLERRSDVSGEEPTRVFVGRAGSFVPVTSPEIGWTLVREKDGEFHAATGTKGYLWAEAETVREMGAGIGLIDQSYFTKLIDAAVDNLGRFGDVEWFLS